MRTEQNRTEQNRTEQNRTEQNRTEQNRSAAESWLNFSRNKAINQARNLPLDTITDNLIVNSNPISALEILMGNFQSRIKLIYANFTDKDDGAKAIKNQLKLSKKFLKDDGAIFVQCDDDNQAYIKVMMDEIFGKQNFVNCIILKTNSTKTTQNSTFKHFKKTKEYILIFRKSSEFMLNPVEIPKSDDEIKSIIKHYNKFIFNKDDDISKWILKSSDKNFYKLKNPDKFIHLTTPKTPVLADIPKDKFATSANGKIYYNDSGKIKKVEFLSQNLSKPLDDIWLNFCDEAKQSKFDDTKTNEVLLQTIIISSTNKNDIVMDFTLKSPISVSVAHRINRQYIGISKNTKPTIQRLQSVIDGEQDGISKSVGWQGGGEFIYFEIADLAGIYMDKIATLDNVVNLYDEILSFNMSPNPLKVSEFKTLSLQNQKEILYDLLKSSTLNLSNTEQIYAISKGELELNKEFYGI